ncbi:DUF3772 domain-containing protein [Paraburkholderia sp. MMS20-SJTR3]|uniref:DUF3772 domain-containing protein n=1 Tax=Paraburkholderia sejongensis TaxID=2886946 RepID=A0ABS8JMH7_9BURK|nr:DUF3772 domain-containing protein [Paraburkholderia sp. MMS20-SJTR3]MCC8391103.1 DUF3772 domain-containing protein [Paraburkholderia sp. MMS20-SJTR3]
MRQVIAFFLSLIVAVSALAPVAAGAASTWSARSEDTADVSADGPVEADTPQALGALQARADGIRQRASSATSDAQLLELDTLSRQAATEADSLMTLSLQPMLARTHAQLDVLGAPPAAGAGGETLAVARQRVALANQQARLDAEIEQAGRIKDGLSNVNAQIARLLHEHLKDQLALRTGSIISADFWRPVVRPDEPDYRRLRAFARQIRAQPGSIWQPHHRLAAAVLLLIAVGCATIGTRVLQRIAASICLRRLPEGRLRRSALAMSTVLIAVGTTIGALQLVGVALASQTALSPSLQSFVNGLFRHTVTCALIAALGEALLCTRHPSWRLPAIADPLARALRPFPPILAGLLLFSGTLEQIDLAVDTSVPLTIFTRGIVALIVALTIGASLMRANRVRTALAAAGESAEARTTLAGLIHAAVSLAVAGTLIALLCGYVSVARFITYEMVWFHLVLCTLYLLTRLSHDACESIFCPAHRSGKAIGQLLGLKDFHLEQIATVLSGLCRSMLIVAAVVALLTGGLGTTPAGLFASIVEVLGGGRLRALNIVPEHLVNAALTCGVGLYLVRSVRGWFDTQLLPKTAMSDGMRASLLTLFANIGYLLVALQTLSVLGVRWHNLAWIVSALSVGIGFGLQEIVKNFISGLILLAERPVKVGDMISLAGIEGDIRRINVRATEIQLADKSTVIVPNSQLIAQNVRNVTMGNTSQGVVTIALTFSLDVDPEQAQDILFNAYADHPSILEHPVPCVVFSQLTADGITLTVTGYVKSPRIAAEIKSQLLFTLLKCLRAANISLSNPRALVVQGTRAGDFFSLDGNRRKPPQRAA